MSKMLFKDALIRHLEESGLSVAEIARRSGVGKGQLDKLRQGKSKSTNVDDAARIAVSFGMTLDDFLSDNVTLAQSGYLSADHIKPITPKDQLVESFIQLSQADQEFLLRVIEGLREK